MGKHKSPSIPNKNGNNTRILAARSSSTFIGPLPPPEILERYNQAVPGMADRLVKDFEKQSEHRMYIEKQVIRSNVIQSYIGQITGFLLGFTALIFGYILIRAGKDVTGIVSIVTSLSWLGGIFIFGKHKQRKQLKEKEENLANQPTS